MLILFGLLPFLLTQDTLKNVPLMLVLLFMGLSVYLYLIYDPTFDRKTFFNWQKGKKELGRLLILFAISAIIMLLLIWIIDPSKLFLLVRTNPLLLLMISIFYPLFSYLLHSQRFIANKEITSFEMKCQVWLFNKKIDTGRQE